MASNSSPLTAEVRLTPMAVHFGRRISEGHAALAAFVGAWARRGLSPQGINRFLRIYESRVIVQAIDPREPSVRRVTISCDACDCSPGDRGQGRKATRERAPIGRKCLTFDVHSG